MTRREGGETKKRRHQKHRLRVGIHAGPALALQILRQVPRLRRTMLQIPHAVMITGSQERVHDSGVGLRGCERTILTKANNLQEAKKRTVRRALEAICWRFNI